MFEREILELEGLARSDADAREPGAELLAVGRRGHELEGGVEILVEVRLDPLRGRREKSIFGAAGGAGCFRNADSGCALYPACTFTTFGMSSALKSWVRKMVSANGVVDWNTFLIPAGVSPFQSGPTTR